MSMTAYQNNLSKTSFFVLLTLCLGFLMYAWLAKPVRHGDGHEYSLISQAFIDHSSPDIRLNDVEVRKAQISTHPSDGYIPQIFDDVISAIVSDKSDIYGIYRSSSGLYYGYHFWFYPAIVASVESLTDYFGANPLASFQIANAFIYCMVIVLCYLISGDSVQRKMSCISIFLLGGGVFYLKWTHPEVFISSVLFLAFYALFIKNRKIAWISGGIAGIQVISLWPIFAIFIVEYVVNNSKRVNHALVDLIKNPWFLISSILPSFSALFYLYIFGKVSLIGAAYSDMSLVSFSHLVSFWFDLDQGVVVGSPIVLALAILGFMRWANLTYSAKLNLLLACAAGLLICLPLLAQTSVNSGQSVFMRYALYAVTPITAWVGVYFIDVIKQQSIRIVLLFLGVFYIFYFHGAAASEDYLIRKPWTNIVLRFLPTIYNPEPGVFYARSTGKEWRKNDISGAYYTDKNGFIRKLLLPISDIDGAIKSICTGQVIDKYGNPLDYSTGVSRKYGWEYFNGYYKCSGMIKNEKINSIVHYPASLPGVIDFKRNEFPSFIDEIYGLSSAESWGRWSDGERVAFKINYGKIKLKRISVVVGGFADNVGKEINVKFGGYNTSLILESAEPREYHITLPVTGTGTGTGTEWLIFYPAHPISPKSLGLSDDARQLGISFFSLKFEV